MTLDILMLNIVIIPQTNGLLQAILMDSGSQVLHHLPQAVVHGFNHFTTSVPEGDTTKLKILLKVV